jgi:hypothetical protein
VGGRGACYQAINIDNVSVTVVDPVGSGKRTCLSRSGSGSEFISTKGQDEYTFFLKIPISSPKKKKL